MRRLLDLAIALPSLFFLSPLLLAVAVCLKIASPGPVLFRQQRVGRYGRLFWICKFRTMHSVAAADGPQVTAADDPRIFRFGRLLRRTKLDELPQLFNVVRGEMGLVGPRPQVPRFVRHYPEPIRDIVLSVRPGLTDPATILYRNEEEILARAADPEQTYITRVLPHKLSLYVDYLLRRTLLSDLRVLAQTLACAVRPLAPTAARRMQPEAQVVSFRIAQPAPTGSPRRVLRPHHQLAPPRERNAA